MATMYDYSVFVWTQRKTMEEFNLLSKGKAFEIAMKSLYAEGNLIPNVRVEIRHPQLGLIYTASNPATMHPAQG